MLALEKITRGTTLHGLLPKQPVTIIDAAWHGKSALEVTFRNTSGDLYSQILYRENESSLDMAESKTPFAFDGDGKRFRLVSEACRIKLAHLFDPYLAVHTSTVEPLPHQITAVYGEMLSRHPLRFLLADDPGAGKTIMAGLLIKELKIRGDVHRCLIVCPGNLTEQWQEELHEKFNLSFELITRERTQSSLDGNPFDRITFGIARLDHLSRNEELLLKLENTEWDLIVCDEAHKMSATYSGRDVKYTKRFHLGKLLSRISRHFLLMTATPHNGKEEDFQLFMSLIDADRFEGKYREGVHTADTSDLMRRMIKEKLVRFDGSPLFPERRAYTLNYTLSPLENELYEEVTSYVKEEFNRGR